MPGLSDIRVTLYDVFAYLIPGLVAFMAVALFAWGIDGAGSSLTVPTLSSVGWIAVLLASYILGHVIQAVATTVLPQPDAMGALTWVPLRKEILAALDVPAPASNSEALDVYEFADILVSQQGNTSDREIYQYREGFYRGLTISLLLGLVATVVVWWQNGAVIVGLHHAVSNREFIAACFLLGSAAYFSYRRYQRFFAYKLHNGFVAYAVIAGLISLPDPTAPVAGGNP